MSQMRVVHLISGLMVGGAEMMLLKLLSGMDQSQYRSVVISLTDRGTVGPNIEKLGIPLYSLGMNKRCMNIRPLSTLLTLLKRHRPHVLQTWMYHADLLGLVGGRMIGLPAIVWNVRCSNVEHSSRMTSWIIKACARLSHRPNAVVVNSESGRVFHASLGYRPQRWAVIPNGFDLNRFSPDNAARAAVRAEIGLHSDALLIGLLGRLDPMKGHDTFLRAAEVIASEHPEVHFVLAGRDVVSSKPSLALQLKQNTAKEAIHLLGERSDISKLLAAMDIVTSSSSYGEGFSNVIGEAMACGVPCVVTDVGDSSAIVGDTGIVVPPRDPEALVVGWRKMLKMGHQGRYDLGKAARSRMEECYNISVVVKRYEELYSSLREGRSPCASA